MKSTIVIALLAFCGATLAVVATEPDSELLDVQIVFRHGDRTPKILYKNDPYKNFNFIEGLAQLTAKGKVLKSTFFQMRI